MNPTASALIVTFDLDKAPYPVEWLERIEQETGIPVRVAKDPLKAVVKGTGELLKCADIIFSSAEEKIYGCSD